MSTSRDAPQRLVSNHVRRVHVIPYRIVRTWDAGRMAARDA